MDIGAHCYIADCNQQDFLPFTCDCCDRVYCLQHRTYDAHECPNAGSKDRRVIQCPLCKQSIRWTMEQDVNLVWEEHAHSAACQHAQQQHQQNKHKKKKKRCAADMCREVLLTSNQFHCNLCNQDVCLKHRFENDHNCEQVRRNQRRQYGIGRSTSSATSTQLQQNAMHAAATVRKGMSSFAASAKAAATSASMSASNLITTASEKCPICRTKFRYASQLIAHMNNAHPETRNNAPRPSSNPTNTSGREVCPQCQARFQNVEALIRHVDAAHAAASNATAAASSSSVRREVCPQCRSEFADVNALIRHVESAHQTQVTTGGSNGSEEKCALM